jgi:hypothetical protein
VGAFGFGRGPRGLGGRPILARPTSPIRGPRVKQECVDDDESEAAWNCGCVIAALAAERFGVVVV